MTDPTLEAAATAIQFDPPAPAEPAVWVDDDPTPARSQWAPPIQTNSYGG